MPFYTSQPMRNYNIKKSGLRHGEYVGWDKYGNRYCIRRDGPRGKSGSWWVYPAHHATRRVNGPMSMFCSGTLELVSLRLGSKPFVPCPDYDMNRWRKVLGHDYRPSPHNRLRPDASRLRHLAPLRPVPLARKSRAFSLPSAHRASSSPVGDEPSPGDPGEPGPWGMVRLG